MEPCMVIPANSFLPDQALPPVLLWIPVHHLVLEMGEELVAAVEEAVAVAGAAEDVEEGEINGSDRTGLEKGNFFLYPEQSG